MRRLALTVALPLVGLLAMLAGCGARSGLDADEFEDDPPRAEPCEALQAIAGPFPLWEATAVEGFSLPALSVRGDGFDLVARQSTEGHPHVHARRVRLAAGGARVELGEARRVIQETHDSHQVAEREGQVAICSGADPGGPLRILLQTFRMSYFDPVSAELRGTTCQGLVPVGDGFRVAYRELIDRETARGLVSSLDAAGRPIGEPFEPAEGLGTEEIGEIEATTRLGTLDDGYVWVKRNTDRNVFFVGLETDESRVRRYDVELGAFYLRAERWPLPDGVVALSWIHTTAETMPGTPVLAVADGEGREVFRHEGGAMARAGFIEPWMTPTPDGLVRVMPDALDGEIHYRIELFGPGARPVGEPVVFVDPGFSSSRTAVAYRDGVILVAWDRRNEALGRDEIVGATLRCGAL